uniref:Glycosyltransferase family 92 protein n=1 Tax=Parascaris univalens TaxID=6257 RepID=A0A915BJW9_PARUN
MRISLLIGICEYFSVAINSTDLKGEHFIFGLRTRVFRYKDYCVLPNVIQSKMSLGLNYYKRITLVLHADQKYLDKTISYQVDSWDGPVSLAVVIPSVSINKSIPATIEKITGLVTDVKGKLSVHIVYRWPMNCKEVSLENGWHVLSSALYPANTARNIARMLSRTKYLLIADYSHIFSLNFERQMSKLAEEVLHVNSKTVLVFRIFEANTTASRVPRDKHTLYEAYKKGEAVEFHALYSPGAHSIPGLEEWFRRNTSYDKPSLSFTLSYNRLSWEPQFVSTRTIPFHDEHFPYTNRDNTVLVRVYFFMQKFVLLPMLLIYSNL